MTSKQWPPAVVNHPLTFCAAAAHALCKRSKTLVAAIGIAVWARVRTCSSPKWPLSRLHWLSTLKSSFRVVAINVQNTPEIKENALFNWTKQDKTCTFSRKSSFSSYIQQHTYIHTINVIGTYRHWNGDSSIIFTVLR